VKGTIVKATPKPWAQIVTTPSVAVLPLVAKSDDRFFPGWVSYDDTVADSPDVEIICGGVNEKPTIGAALWRQGNLFHFGFDLAPGQMNAVGRALLVDAVAYIARFRDDRAICVTPSAFAGGVSARTSLAKFLANEEYPLDYFTDRFDPAALKGVTRERAALREWFESHRDWLHPGDKGRFFVDADAEALGLAYDKLDSIEEAILALDPPPAANGADAAAAAARSRHALNLVARYLPEGPGASAPAADWSYWFESNRPWLFYSEWGGYRWYVDPLAKSRGVPTASLRGPARADLPAGDLK
jgi:hypothetical protein